MMQSQSLKITVEPTAEPIGLDDAKDFLRVDSSEDDALILSLITAARSYCETYTNRHFATRTAQMYMDDFPGSDTIEMPRPFDSTTASPIVKYYATGSTSATLLSSTAYWVDNQHEPGRIVLKDEVSWPTQELRSANGLEVTMVTGYGAESDVPDGVKHAMRMLVAHWYANREAVVVGSINSYTKAGVHALLAPFVVPFVP